MVILRNSIKKISRINITWIDIYTCFCVLNRIRCHWFGGDWFGKDGGVCLTYSSDPSGQTPKAVRSCSDSDKRAGISNIRAV